MLIGRTETALTDTWRKGAGACASEHMAAQGHRPHRHHRARSATRKQTRSKPYAPPHRRRAKSVRMRNMKRMRSLSRERSRSRAPTPRRHRRVNVDQPWRSYSVSPQRTPHKKPPRSKSVTPTRGYSFRTHFQLAQHKSCWYCGKRGHLQNDCYMKRWEGKLHKQQEELLQRNEELHRRAAALQAMRQQQVLKEIELVLQRIDMEDRIAAAQASPLKRMRPPAQGDPLDSGSETETEVLAASPTKISAHAWSKAAAYLQGLCEKFHSATGQPTMMDQEPDTQDELDSVQMGLSDLSLGQLLHLNSLLHPETEPQPSKTPWPSPSKPRDREHLDKVAAHLHTSEQELEGYVLMAKTKKDALQDFERLRQRVLTLIGTTLDLERRLASGRLVATPASLREYLQALVMIPDLRAALLAPPRGRGAEAFVEIVDTVTDRLYVSLYELKDRLPDVDQGQPTIAADNDPQHYQLLLTADAHANMCFHQMADIERALDEDTIPDRQAAFLQIVAIEISLSLWMRIACKCSGTGDVVVPAFAAVTKSVAKSKELVTRLRTIWNLSEGLQQCRCELYSCVRTDDSTDEGASCNHPVVPPGDENDPAVERAKCALAGKTMDIDDGPDSPDDRAAGAGGGAQLPDAAIAMDSPTSLRKDTIMEITNIGCGPTDQAYSPDPGRPTAVPVGVPTSTLDFALPPPLRSVSSNTRAAKAARGRAHGPGAPATSGKSEKRVIQRTLNFANVSPPREPPVKKQCHDPAASKPMRDTEEGQEQAPKSEPGMDTNVAQLKTQCVKGEQVWTPRLTLAAHEVEEPGQDNNKFYLILLDEDGSFYHHAHCPKLRAGGMAYRGTVRIIDAAKKKELQLVRKRSSRRNPDHNCCGGLFDP